MARLSYPPSKYQPGKQADLHAELFPVPARRGGTSLVGRSSSLPGWYRYQLGGEANFLAGHAMDEADTGHPGHPVDDQVYDQYK
ncbi:hypothetical protein PCANC_24017 [Puccinia coronata f. sp. avenae]|uniref:Uncharacterized protein n=1 Tax=Puccinia coronata f. sp. avenae TaxID=200324 RepID=A0A2N5TX25_9BASI|nr:hypothetical protein PCANC_24017 [Puccinia coronata f. sp. avenae]